MTRLLVFCVALFLSLPAFAAPAIDQAGADALKTRLQTMLTSMTENYKKAQQTLKLDGQLMVEPSDSYYAVTTPHISILSKDGTRTIGMLAINAIPTDDPDIYKVAMAVPTPITNADPMGKVYQTITLGRQTMNGQVKLLPSAPVFLTLNASYNDVRLLNTATDTEVSIPSMTMTLNLTKGAGDLWSGPSEKSLQNVSYRVGKEKLSVGNLSVSSNSSGIDFTKPSTFSLPVSAPVKNLIGNNVLRYAQSATVSGTASDIAYEDGVYTYAAKFAALQTTLSDLMKQKTSIAWTSKLDGITTTDPSAAKLLPIVVASKGSIKDADLARLTYSDAPLLSTLAASGTEILLENSSSDSPLFSAKGQGNYSGKEKAGQFTFTIRGLEELAAWASTPNSAAQRVALLPPLLTFLQLTSQPAKDVQGQMVRTYKIEQTKDGRVLLNGNEIGTLLQSMIPTAKSAAPRLETSAPAAPKP